MNIESSIEAVARAYGHSFISPTAILTDSTLRALSGLARDLGMEWHVIDKARPSDLVAIYAYARAHDEQMARLYAALIGGRIEARNARNAGRRMDPVIDAPFVPPTMPDLLADSPTRSLADVPHADIEALKARVHTLEMQGEEGREQADELRRAIEALKDAQPLRVIVTPPAASTPVDVGLTHKVFPQVLAWLESGTHVMAWGPAASGKTHLAEQCALALGVPAYDISSVRSVTELIGYKSPLNGEYYGTALRQAYEFGGCFLFDEMDNSHPEAITAMNMLLANVSFTFPDKRVMKHERFYVIAGTNTPGNGASSQYSSRKKLDGASITRFARVYMGYDEALERAITVNEDWTRHVQRVRAIMVDEMPEAIISPRASIFGGKALAGGKITWQEAEDALLFAGLPEVTVNRIRARL